jgi:hypothetical protein
MPRWLRRWRLREERRRVVEPDAALRDVDPIEELIRVINEAQERDADDERRLDLYIRRDRPSSYQRRRPERR